MVVEGVLWCGTGWGVITGQKIRARSTSQSCCADRWKGSGAEPWRLSGIGWWQCSLTYFLCCGEWNMRKIKHFRRADVFISLVIPSHQKCGIFSANLRKFYCLVYKMKAYVWWLTGHSAVWVVFAELAWGEGWLWQLACLQDIFILSSFKIEKLKKGLTIPMSGMNIASPKAFLTCGAPSPHVPSKKKNHEYNLSLTFFVYNPLFTAHFWLGLLSILHRLQKYIKSRCQRNFTDVL